MQIIKVFPNLDELNIFAAENFFKICENAIEKNGRFSIALAGGSTPKKLYELLASEIFRRRFNREKTFFFFGDERNVPKDSEESNFRMAYESLLKPLEIADGNIFRWETELNDPAKTAENYEARIRDFFNLRKNEFPQFDLILLGMGDDGHTASLFPFTEALSEEKKTAVSNYVEKLDTARLTLTFPAINSARNIFFIVSGASKAQTLKEVLEGDFQPERLPSQRVKPDGDLYWLIDKAAAESLK